MEGVYYKCPNCGSYVSDNSEKDILKCEHCGTTITKPYTWYDKSLQFLYRRAKAKEKLEQEKIAREAKAAKISAWGLCITLVCAIIMVLIFT